MWHARMAYWRCRRIHFVAKIHLGFERSLSWVRRINQHSASLPVVLVPCHAVCLVERGSRPGYHPL